MCAQGLLVTYCGQPFQAGAAKRFLAGADAARLEPLPRRGRTGVQGSGHLPSIPLKCDASTCAADSSAERMTWPQNGHPKIALAVTNV